MGMDYKSPKEVLLVYQYYSTFIHPFNCQGLLQVIEQCAESMGMLSVDICCSFGSFSLIEKIEIVHIHSASEY